jgi:hypothetical protein
MGAAEAGEAGESCALSLPGASCSFEYHTALPFTFFDSPFP